MAFRFSLAPLLKLRSALDQIEEGKLLLLRREEQLLRLTLEQMVAARRALKLEAFPNTSGSASSQGLTGADIKFSSFLRTQMAWQEQAFEEQLTEKQKETKRQMQAFLDARRQRKVLETLHDSELAAYGIEERRREQRRLDDMFLAQLMRSRRTASRG